MDAKYLINFIKESKKTTPVKAYINGKLEEKTLNTLKFYSNDYSLIIGELDDVLEVLEKNKSTINNYHLEIDRRNSKIPLLDLKKINARIEPGSIIREHVEIGNNAVVMMGAIVNIGAIIGSETMIDMNSVIGGRAIIGKRCHIGAGAIISGVIEPPSSKPVIIEDDCFIGANSVILEGITIGKGAVVGAGSIVTKDVLANSVVVGNPAKFLKMKDENLAKKSEIVDDLR